MFWGKEPKLSLAVHVCTPVLLIGCSLTKNWTHICYGDLARGEFDINHQKSRGWRVSVRILGNPCWVALRDSGLLAGAWVYEDWFNLKQDQLIKIDNCRRFREIFIFFLFAKICHVHKTDNSRTNLLLAKSSESAWFYKYWPSKLRYCHISVNTNLCEKSLK